MLTDQMSRPDSRAPGKNKSQTQNRSFLLTIHLWLGLSLGALLVLIGLSGSTLIFRYELERLIFPSLTHTSSPAPATDPTANLDLCRSAAQAVNPLKTVRSVRLPVHPDGTLEWLTIPIGSTTKEEATTIYTDPHTCSILGTRGPRKDVMSFVVNFHHALFLGKNGAYLQTCVAAATILMAISGLTLWWPRRWSWSRVRPRASARPLHYAIGFWAMWPLIVIASTGCYMAWRSTINKALLPEPASRASSASKPALDKSPTTRPDAESKAKKESRPLSLNTIIAAAHAAKPDAEWRILTIPQKAKESVAITYQLPDEYGRTGNNQILLKQANDGTVHVINVSELRSSSRINRSLTGLMQIHYGEFAGIASRLVWCVTGLMPAVLFCSGFLMWRRQIKSRLVAEKVRVARAH
jgi:uncharacterized iron-regulated membrane protein